MTQKTILSMDFRPLSGINQSGLFPLYVCNHPPTSPLKGPYQIINWIFIDPFINHWPGILFSCLRWSIHCWQMIVGNYLLCGCPVITIKWGAIHNEGSDWPHAWSYHREQIIYLFDVMLWLFLQNEMPFMVCLFLYLFYTWRAFVHSTCECNICIRNCLSNKCCNCPSFISLVIRLGIRTWPLSFEGLMDVQEKGIIKSFWCWSALLIMRNREGKQSDLCPDQERQSIGMTLIPQWKGLFCYCGPI